MYRLPTEAEREYFARAGTQTAYWWGEAADAARAQYDRRARDSAGPKLIKAKSGSAPSPVSTSATDTRKLGTVPVDAFLPNPWGLYGVLGSVGEWTADCWNTSYLGLPVDGTAAQVGDCKKHVLRGGGWAYWPEDIRSAYREAAPMDDRYSHVGFRLVREIP
jgi:formylglycine-generating enzyme required for sulfatase activity